MICPLVCMHSLQSCLHCARTAALFRVHLIFPRDVALATTIKLVPHQHDDSRHNETRRLVVSRGGGAAAPTTTIACLKSRRRPVVTTGHDLSSRSDGHSRGQSVLALLGRQLPRRDLVVWSIRELHLVTWPCQSCDHFWVAAMPKTNRGRPSDVVWCRRKEGERQGFFTTTYDPTSRRVGSRCVGAALHNTIAFASLCAVTLCNSCKQNVLAWGCHFVHDTTDIP